MSSSDPELSQESDERHGGIVPFDERAMYILAAEHSSLASARSLAYNEAFTRIGMFLSFLSMSFIALALIAQATSFGDSFLSLAVVVLTFDLIVGLITLGRILGTTSDDLIAVQAMARVRRGYLELAPYMEPYFTHGTSDDLAGVMRTYRVPERRAAATLYAFTTSTGMMTIIVALVGGMLAGVLALLTGIGPAFGFAVGAVATLAIFVVVAALSARYFARDQASIEVRFPSGPGEAPAAGAPPPD